MKTFVIFDEIIQGVISASNEKEMEEKIVILLSSVREPIKSIAIPSFNDFNDFEAHEITVVYDVEDCDEENFFIQRFNIL